MKTTLKPSPLFTDGAVLCRNKEIRVFGEAADGVKVRAELENRDGRMLGAGQATARDGRFMILLPPQEAQTGCRLTLSAGEESFTAQDVAVGEVYLAGGQSNMELELRNADEGPAMIATRRDPLMRFFNVPRKAYACPEQEKAFADTRWQAVDPETSGYNSAVAFFFADRIREKYPDLPVGIIGCYWGGTSITCWMDEETLRFTAEGKRYLDEYAGKCGKKTMKAYLKEEEAFNRTLNEWNDKVAAFREANPGAEWTDVNAACGLCPWFPPAGPGSPYRPAGLEKTMLRMIAPVSLTAVLYYQGEEDTWRTDRYDDLMIALIRHWRKLFRDAEMPFLFVQLPMWIDFGAEDTFRWPATRLAQAAARDAVRNTGMVCLLDQGEYGNIHPTRKRPVGERLAEMAEYMLRGEGEVSPRATGKYTEGNTVIVRLSGKVTTRDGKTPRLMEVAGEDGKFYPACALASGNTLRVWAPEVEEPVYVRYAWTDWSDRVNLFGTNRLPVEPFWL